MGRGRGYYDKYLSQPGFRGVKAGVCYAHQLVGELPVEPHDVFMSDQPVGGGQEQRQRPQQGPGAEGGYRDRGNPPPP